MDTPIQRIRCAQDDSYTSHDDSEQGEDLSMEDGGEHASTANNAVAVGEKSIDSSMSATPVDVKTQEEFLKQLCDGLSVHYPELLFSMVSGTMDGASVGAIPVMLIAQTTLHPYLQMAWFHVFR